MRPYRLNLTSAVSIHSQLPNFQEPAHLPERQRALRKDDGAFWRTRPLLPDYSRAAEGRGCQSKYYKRAQPHQRGHQP